ncbi:methyltransferas-like protein [Massariosphaeria phaeospora]|uniref:carnosine N-methyltransferase n=1 Tax=Massariosphaeria phaeospora TaxID=100035 RepID=A0A7C8M0D3_9PLEO|nr:methyltransferas-like protein [Massariosphaeria phaeospora]
MSAKERDGDFNPMGDADEKKHVLSVLDSFRSYRRLAHLNGTHVRRQAFYSLPSEHWTLLSRPPFSILDSLSKLDHLIELNTELAEAIFTAGFNAFVAPHLDSEWVASVVPVQHAHDEYQMYSSIMDSLNAKTTQTDAEKARSCVNQFYREWSADGAAERDKCFEPIMSALHSEFAKRREQATELDRSEMKVLVPGAGLGRLVFDICSAGFCVEGNEISYHELMASSLLLNHTDRVGQHTIAPFALNGSNHLTRDDQFRTFPIPDVHPATQLTNTTRNSKVPASERMSMAAGDFCVLYSQPDAQGTFDVVATVFFIDTAPNIIRYIDAVRNCLKPNGIWINLGPLLWHHAARSQASSEDSELKKAPADEVEDAGIADPGSVELTNEEVMALVEHLGFSMEKSEHGTIKTGYISNPRSMLQNTYKPTFWIARKKNEPGEQTSGGTRGL